ncbi:MAG TPA: glycosyltransferase family 39 protein [Steroidobacteraceae bacterium]|jgi:4-amino-4-deoxy-L-arabinose transferase-like glycosyltransferase|nr:glycosyltransferase family 39 protein [Steroidobacteraceae bacterium]
MPSSPTNFADVARPAAGKHAWAGAIILALAPLWLLGMFDRGLWTPDEPREADIAWRMSQQSERSIPSLAGTPFLEKPPLTYWLAGASTAAFGDSAALVRLPNLLYALMLAAAIGTLAARMAGRQAALVATLISASALLSYRVLSWLAPDAALLAGSAVALLGAYSGYTASASARKFWGYTLMHAGAAMGFMAKSAPGWLVPALALLTLIGWERRWSELRRWELYAGAALQALLIGPWILAVAATSGGADSLRVLFWENLAGRFAALAATPGHDYAQGHLNWWGKYFSELPVYLLPWTLLAAAAVVRAARALRSGHASHAPTAGTPWRFAVCAFLPFLGVLSLAATARDVYAAPAILGFALLVALWADALPRRATRFDAACLTATRWLVALIACLCAAFLGLLAAAESQVAIRTADGVVALAVVPLTLLTLHFAAALQRAHKYSASIAATYAAYALAFTVTGLLVLPVIDRWQDLAALARRIERDSAGRELAVLNPDETTIAILDHRLRMSYATLSPPRDAAARVVADWLHQHAGEGRVLVMLPGHAPGEVSRLISRWQPLAVPDDGLAGALAAAGSVRISARYELPQGRRYALLSAARP